MFEKQLSWLARRLSPVWDGPLVDDFALEMPGRIFFLPQERVEDRLPTVAEVLGASDEDNGGIVENFGMMNHGIFGWDGVANDFARSGATQEGQHLPGGELNKASSIGDANAEKIRRVRCGETVCVGGIGCSEKGLHRLAESSIGD